MLSTMSQSSTSSWPADIRRPTTSLVCPGTANPARWWRIVSLARRPCMATNVTTAPFWDVRVSRHREAPPLHQVQRFVDCYLLIVHPFADENTLIRTGSLNRFLDGPVVARALPVHDSRESSSPDWHRGGGWLRCFAPMQALTTSWISCLPMRFCGATGTDR